MGAATAAAAVGSDHCSARAGDSAPVAAVAAIQRYQASLTRFSFPQECARALTPGSTLQNCWFP